MGYELGGMQMRDENDEESMDAFNSVLNVLSLNGVPIQPDSQSRNQSLETGLQWVPAKLNVGVYDTSWNRQTTRQPSELS